MHNINRIKLIPVIIICVFLTGCVEIQANKPTLTPLPSATSTSLLAPTSSPSLTPTSTPTLTPISTPDVKIELMKQVTLFLNSEEPYRENEDLYWRVFRPYRTKKTPKLGIIDATVDHGTVNFQGVFLGFAETTDGIVLLLGVQDKDGERFVTPLKLYDQNMELFKETGRGFQYLVRTKDFSNFLGEPLFTNSKDVAKLFLSTRIGQVFGIQLSLLPEPPLSEEHKEAMLALGWSNPDLSVQQMNDFRNNFLELNKDLSASLWIPSTDYWDPRFGGLTIAQSLQKMGKASGAEIKITSAEDIDHVLQIEWLPGGPDYIAGSSR